MRAKVADQTDFCTFFKLSMDTCYLSTDTWFGVAAVSDPQHQHNQRRWSILNNIYSTYILYTIYHIRPAVYFVTYKIYYILHTAYYMRAFQNVFLPARATDFTPESFKTCYEGNIFVVAVGVDCSRVVAVDSSSGRHSTPMMRSRPR